MNKEISRLIQYALHNELLEPADQVYATNKVLDLLQLHSFENIDVEEEIVSEPSTILSPLLDYAVKQNLIEVDTVLNRDLFEAKIMDCVLSRPSHIIMEFNERYFEESPEAATNYYYHLSQKSNYIKTSRTDKNVRFKSETPYGIFDMTINLSKPEKDPRDIIASKSKVSSDYPKCLLCKEHEGFTGRPGRSNHRIIPLSLNNETFFLQYSPYVYYNEHCIVLMSEHEPMNVSDKTFRRLFDFVDMFPHYFLGSNAGLPIVGGSILAHEHYQGGRHHFPIEDARVLDTFTIDDVTIHKLKWPLSVLRLESKNKESLIKKATTLFDLWEQYTDESVGILSKTTEPHNAITPIARKNEDTYILDMTLRNNRTSKEFPLGIFHPHPAHHHIKKENIGLIEVMGLAVLPARLKEELQIIEQCLEENISLPEELHIHQEWFNHLEKHKPSTNLHTFIEEQTTLKFVACLEDSGVFKQTEEGQLAFDQFIRRYQHEFH